jgi:hypothetical protein
MRQARNGISVLRAAGKLVAGPEQTLVILAVVAGLTVALSSGAASAPPGAASTSARDETQSLIDKLLANPADVAARSRLTELQQQKRQERADALDALALGLEAHLDGRIAAAAQNLQKALECPYAVALANAVLSTTLADLARPYAVAARSTMATPSTRTTSTVGPCPRCSGIGWTDCRVCASTGVKPCTVCRGTGSGPAGRTGTSSMRAGCNRCSDRGADDCTVCRGRGVIACVSCGGSVPAGPPSPSASTGANRSTEEIRKVISMARYLRDGGLDLYSRSSKDCSPKAPGAAGAVSSSPASRPASSPTSRP